MRWASKTAAMALSDRSVSIDDEQLAKEPKLAIVLGTEGDGLACSTIAACDYTVKIPMAHGRGFAQRGCGKRRGVLAAGQTVKRVILRSYRKFWL